MRKIPDMDQLTMWPPPEPLPVMKHVASVKCVMVKFAEDKCLTAKCDEILVQLNKTITEKFPQK